MIHADPESLPSVFGHWSELLERGGPLTVAFFAANTPVRRGEPFDHRAVTAHQLSPEVIARQLDEAGFVDIAISTRPYEKPERAINHATPAAVWA